MSDDINTDHQENLKKDRNTHLFFRPVALAIETAGGVNHISEQIRAEAEALTAIQKYQGTIKTQAERIDRIEFLLVHGKISEEKRKNAANLLPILKQGLNEHQTELQNLINRCPPRMQAQFSRP